AYGQSTEAGVELLNLSTQDLADLSDITADEASKIMTKLSEKGWISQAVSRSALVLKNPKQLAHLAGRL
ncbi:MAG TPA: winged helix-turn-helix domain-containing protein, partial [Leptolyngbyaceae cyanobacterium M65_K2018_010]|nr:winged helix-turn-helix domain-containing protein [Leptolyngbyaceae cyanobacterium M65_K2018_010]